MLGGGSRVTKATPALAWEVWPLGFAGQEKEQGRAGLLSTVHALEFGPRGRGWSSFPFLAGSHLEWVALGIPWWISALGTTHAFSTKCAQPQGEQRREEG